MVTFPPSDSGAIEPAPAESRPEADGPLVSLILVTDDTIQTIRRTLALMRAQTSADRVEMVIVCPSRDRLGLDPAEVEPFGACQVVETGQALSTGHMQAAGVRAATTPAVFYVEEHNFPPANLVDAIIREVLEQDRPVVGFAMAAANPGVVSHAHLYGQFGPAVAPVASGPRTALAGHHTAYRRSILMEYDGCLTEMMSNEAVLHEALRRRGIELYMCADIVIPHVQVSRFFSYARTEFVSQRSYGAVRAGVQNWSWRRKLVYVAGSPLIPFLRVWRSLQDIRRTGRTAELAPRILPVMFAANVCGAVGEVTGYLFGLGARTAAARMAIELDRYAFVTDSDRAQIPAVEPAQPR